MRDIPKLRADIDRLLGALQTHISSGAPAPSFDVKALPIFPLPLELEDTRQDALEALEEAAALLRGPIPYLMDMTGPRVFVHAAVHTIGRFSVAQKLKLDETVYFEELASRCGIPTDNFQRILRVAIANRIFDEPQAGMVRHNAVSAAIANEPKFNPWLRVCYEEMFPAQLKAAEALEKSPGTEDPKQTAYSLAHNITDASFWDILGTDPARAQRFAEATTIIQASPALDLAHIINNFPWKTTSSPQTIVDVGGSHGPVMAALLRKNPSATTIVEDLPEVVATATVPHDLTGRLSFKAQDFLAEEQRQRGADVYFFRSVFHDWPDGAAVRILRNQVPALKAGARVVVCEVCLPMPGSVRVVEEQLLRYVHVWCGEFFSWLGERLIWDRGYDWGMSLTFNGKERDEMAWRDLLARADGRYRLERIVTPKGSMLSIIEVSWQGKSEDMQG